MMRLISKTGRRPQAGFSLVEVLIALVIMSVGMLGIAGLYVQGMQAGRTSMFRHNAVILAGDIADRIRANPRAGNAYANATGANNNCVGGSGTCTPAEMAANDVLLWNAQAADSLSGGTVAVVFTPAAGVTPPNYQITVTWNEPGQSPAPSYVVSIPVLGI